MTSVEKRGFKVTNRKDEEAVEKTENKPENLADECDRTKTRKEEPEPERRHRVSTRSKQQLQPCPVDSNHTPLLVARVSAP